MSGTLRRNFHRLDQIAKTALDGTVVLVGATSAE
jgi:hypothetical protein